MPPQIILLDLKLPKLDGLAVLTARTDAQNKLRDSEERLAALNEELEARVAARTADLQTANEELARWATVFRNAQWGVALADADSNLVLCNAAFAEMHGYALDELVGAPASRFRATSQEVALAEVLTHARATGRHTFEMRRVRKDGAEFPALVDLAVERGKNGAVSSYLLNVQDITHRKQVESALHASDERLRARPRQWSERTPTRLTR